MPNFNAGTITSVTLDENDTLSVNGPARLQVTVGTKPKFETNTAGNLTFGPFGFVTYITINGNGQGSYSQQPSNVAVPMMMVDMSPAQLASPTPAQLAATNVLYQRNGTPYDIYQSNGTALVLIGTGGGGGGSSTPAPIIYATTIPLDAADPGKVMTSDGNTPAGGNERIAIVANTVLTPGSTRVVNGYCAANFYMDGTHTLDVSAFNVANGGALLVSGVLTGIAGHLYAFSFVNVASPPVLPQVGVIDLGPVDVVAPTVTAASVANATKSVINLTLSEPISSAMPTTMTFAVNAGHALTGTPTYVDSTHINLATSTAFASGEAARTLSYSLPGTNPIQDIAGNNLAAFSGLAITNNALPAARADTFAGASVNPPSDGGSGWVNETGTALKLSSPKRLGRASGTQLVASLDTGTVTQDQTFTFNPGNIGAGTEDSDGYFMRYLDSSNFLAVFIKAQTGRVDFGKVVGGSFTSLGSSSGGLLTANASNTLRCYFPTLNNFMVDLNGSNVLNYTITDASLRTGTKIAIDLEAYETQQTYTTNLA